MKAGSGRAPRVCGVALLLSATACGSSADRSSSLPESPAPPAAGWTLVWSDEFEGPSGALVDAGKWAFDLGGNGWGNQELEYYTDRPRNASLNGEGALAIQALRETYTGPDGVTRAGSL